MSFDVYVLVEFSFKRDGEETEVECDAGENLLEIAQGNDVELKSMTCSVLLYRYLRWRRLLR